MIYRDIHTNAHKRENWHDVITQDLLHGDYYEYTCPSIEAFREVRATNSN